MTRVLGTPLTDYLPALGLLALTIVYLVTAYGYSADSRAVPAGVAWVMIVLLLADLLSRTRTPAGAKLMHWLNPAGEPGKTERPSYSTAKQIGAVLWIAGFAAALILVGILYAVPLYVFSSLFLKSRRGLVFSIAAAAAATAMIWGLFGPILQIELFPGILFQ